MTDPHAHIAEAEKGVMHLSIAAGRWQLMNTVLQQALSYLTFFILARLLLPEDFGVFSLIMLVPTFIDGITTFGLDTSAFQRKEKMGVYLNVVWTFNIIRSAAIFLTAFLAAPFIARFFHIEEALPALYFAGLGILVQSFFNIGQNYLFLTFDFKKILIRDVLIKASYSIATIALAVMFESYWALFLGNMISFICGVVTTYLIHPYRPQFDFRFNLLNDLREFSQWFYGQEMVQQLERTVADALLGRFAGAANLGLFTKAKALAQAPTSPIVSAINKVSFSSYLYVQDSLTRAAEGVRRTFDILCTLAVPYLVAIFLTGERIVLIVFGPNWIAITPYLKVFTMAATIHVLTTTAASAVFNGLGKPRIQFFVSSVYTAVAFAGFVLLVPPWGIWGAAYATLAAVAIAASMTLYFLFTLVRINLVSIAWSAAVIICAALAPLPVAVYLLKTPFFYGTPGYLLLILLTGAIYATVIAGAGIFFRKGPYETFVLLALSLTNTTLSKRLLALLPLFGEPAKRDVLE